MQTTLKAGLLALTLAFSVPADAQQIYQWKDENGKVHFTDQPPPVSQAKEMKTLPTAPPPPDSAVTVQRNQAEKALEAKEQQEKAAKEKAEADAKKARDENNKQACAQMANQLAGLKSGLRIARSNAKGEREFVSDNERSAKIEELQTFMDKNCQ